jgi:class 3 adenylate cyclase
MGARKHGHGGAPSMWGRAERQAGDGAGALFARLEGAAVPAAAAAVLERLAARMRAGEWSDELAELVARAEALEVALLARDERQRGN